MNRININNFDFLRAIFAFTVALSHLIELSQVKVFEIYQSYFNTRLAIDGFFIISGFLIAKSYENSNNVKEYIIKRVKRILPAYIFTIIVSALALSLISINSFEGYFFNIQFWKYLFANLTFQNYIEPCLPGVFNSNHICAVNGALWTIKIEEAFYLLLPLFYWLIRSKKINFYVLSILIYLISIAYFSYFIYTGNYRIAKQLPGAFAFFITGIMFYKNFFFLIKWKHFIIIPSLLLFFLEQYIFNTQFLKPVTYGFMVFYIAYNFKYLNSFGKYGDFTYGIYIYHFPIIQIFTALGLFKIYNPIAVSIIIIILTLILSVFSWHVLELPFLSKSRKLRQKAIMTTNL